MADTNQDINEKKEPYDTESEESFDAKVMSEEIGMGERQAPNTNVESDYEKSKQYSQSGSGSKESNAPGNPNDFRDMAKGMKSKQR